VARCADILKCRPGATTGVIARSGWRRKLINAAFAARSELPCRHWDLAVDDQQTIERLRRAANALPRTATFAALCAKAITYLDPNDVDGRSDIEEAIAEIQASCTGEPSIRSAIRPFLHDDIDQAITPGVHLLNAHTGKGQQFDWVFVPGLENGHVPDFRALSTHERLEERRVLLVMLSRAKEGVIVSRAAQLISKKGKPYSRDPSPWWPDLAATAAMRRDQLEAALSALSV
jgi:DNA helicase II / ATP-dependent DNA helicase PcrA